MKMQKKAHDLERDDDVERSDKKKSAKKSFGLRGQPILPTKSFRNPFAKTK